MFRIGKSIETASGLLEDKGKGDGEGLLMGMRFIWGVDEMFCDLTVVMAT